MFINFRFGECFPLFFDVDDWWKIVKIYITLVACPTCCSHRHTFFDTNYWNSLKTFLFQLQGVRSSKGGLFSCTLERCNLFL